MSSPRLPKNAALALLLCACLVLLCGCSGGQEIESCLFVLSLAVDPAEGGNLTVTIKALSGTREAVSGSISSRSEDPSSGQNAPSGGATSSSALEEAEPGYIVMSATASSCLRALDLLSATTPRTVNLSQLQELVVSRTLAESGATLSILKEIYALYRANSAAIVVVTPDNAGDFIRRQRTVLGVRLSKYLQVLFEHFSDIDTIPPNAQLASVIASMESGMNDAAVVYAAGNAFDSTLVLPGAPETDRLPGHLPRTSPAENEYLGSAVFSGQTMTGTLTGDETSLLCLMMGEAQTRTFVINDAQYKTNLPTRVRRSIDEADGALCVHISMNMAQIAGQGGESAADVARQIELAAANLLRKLQAAGSDAVGFGRLAARGYWTIDAWEAANWPLLFCAAPVRVTVDVQMQ